MARLSKEEQKAKHLSDLNKARLQRFYENHKLITFGAKLDEEKYREITEALKKRGITQKQFLENAIDQFLKAK